MSQEPTSITIFGDDQRSLALNATPELLELLDHTALINQRTTERFHYSFSGLLLAFVFGRHRISDWLREYIARVGADLAAILRYRDLTGKDEEIRSLAGREIDLGKTYPEGRRTATTSAMLWIERAIEFAKEQGHSWVGLRHMMGAVIFTPDFHSEDIDRWKFDRVDWAMAYLEYVKRDLPDDLDFWKWVNERVFGGVRKQRSVQSKSGTPSFSAPPGVPTQQKQPEAPSVPKQTPEQNVPPKQAAPASVPQPPRTTPKPQPTLVPQPRDEAASAHIATDSWTVDDKLGHNAYARAIYRFIVHDKTEAPLAISIQAPWGGGKSSLMRMVQKELDPDVVKKLEDEREGRRLRDEPRPPKEVPSGELRAEMSADSIRLRDVLEEIRAWKNPGKEKEAGQHSKNEEKKEDARTKKAKGKKKDENTVTNPSVPELPEGKRRVTVWFNAWKYESTEQVWAGLADCILRQVTERMTVRDRQIFWLQLQLSRLDTEKIERRILDRIAAEWWRLARPWAWGALALVAAFLVAVLTGNAWLQRIGVSGSFLSIVASGLKLFRQHAETKTRVEEEPADLTLSEYLQLPDYRGKAGFLHEVAEDLNRIMKAIRADYRPIVVFIDDLDRCSPEKVAAVTEGINLFLAGEFPDCIFVFGMDAEMVAAALEEAHGEVIAKLPRYATQMPIGWRFMDKFVQLPFVIPPPEPADIRRYVESLFEDQAQASDLPDEVKKKIKEVARIPEPEAVAAALPNVSEFVKGKDLTPRQKEEAAFRLDQVKKLAEIDEEIKRASRDDAAVREFVLRYAPEFFRNPRDLKRFLNTFRLYDFLRIARERSEKSAPSRDLIAKWIVLSLKWPQVVRWMHRLPGGETGEPARTEESACLEFRLRQLEVFAADVSDQDGVEEWTQLLTASLGEVAENLQWISDRALLQFFRKMGQEDESQRLSFGAGKGLW